MLNVEKLKERLEAYQKKCAEDKTAPWKRIDEIYGNPLIRAYFDGYYNGWEGFDKQVYVCKDKEQYQEFHDMGYEDGKKNRLINENFDDNCSEHS